MTKPAPGLERPVRPGGPNVGGGNRPGINNNNNHHNNWFSNNNFVNVGGGGWGYPGYGGGWHGGYGNWGNHWYNHGVNPGYNGWYHGCWNGNWGGYGGGFWAPFAFGAATWGLLSTCSNWGLGYGYLGYGAGGYVNPYYSAIPAAVVAASPYDYSQPIIVNNYVNEDGEPVGAGAVADGSAPAPADNPSTTDVDKALADFKDGDYKGALAGFDKALKASPKDSVLHEVRALALFALGRYDEAAAALNAVLAAAPGMDWTTMSGLYGSVDDYTSQLRRLEAFCKSNPGNAAGYFVLAYHYLVGGHADLAAEALEVVVAKQPNDAVARRLLDAITPPKEAAEEEPSAETNSQQKNPEPSGPETDLVGRWKASAGDDTVELSVTEDFKFAWKASPKGKPPIELSGTISTSSDGIALESEKAGTMLAKVKSKGADAFEFALVGAPKEAKPLVFERQK